MKRLIALSLMAMACAPPEAAEKSGYSPTPMNMNPPVQKIQQSVWGDLNNFCPNDSRYCARGAIIKLRLSYNTDWDAVLQGTSGGPWGVTTSKRVSPIAQLACPQLWLWLSLGTDGSNTPDLLYSGWTTAYGVTIGGPNNVPSNSWSALHYCDYTFHSPRSNDPNNHAYYFDVQDSGYGSNYYVIGYRPGADTYCGHGNSLTGMKSFSVNVLTSPITVDAGNYLAPYGAKGMWKGLYSDGCQDTSGSDWAGNITLTEDYKVWFAGIPGVPGHWQYYHQQAGW
jgi:hypothetical protein